MSNFLPEPELGEAAQRLYDEDLADHGYVMNLSRLWAHQPEAQGKLFGLLGEVAAAGGLTLRQRAVLVTACASTIGYSSCSLAWGARLAAVAGAGTAGGLLRGDDALRAAAPEPVRRSVTYGRPAETAP
ncbi:hypothetical protein ABZ907_38545 [Nonomuraea wenchangensis]